MPSFVICVDVLGGHSSISPRRTPTWVQLLTEVYFLLQAALGGELFDVYTDQDFWGQADKARFYVACVALGLSHLHSKHVIWRDLKLENCLMDAKGYLKITDFGISKMVTGKTYTVCGTADYFAPETLKQVGHNRAADWWALGIMLFIMIAGYSPFDAPEVTQIYKNIIKGEGPQTLTHRLASICIILQSLLIPSEHPRHLKPFHFAYLAVLARV
ncbi:unnamed protein product [Cladocopium goreaui]|uniref:Protein kinase domain-containing protein n=1 Tax=Cladocopium goreaui TaxID=2562237 RepID=A0A9P1DR03_9DINO|nr:unnamed protein product [Cladocopium goreaui]